MATGGRADTLAFLAEHRAARTGELADRLVAAIERDHPGYRGTAVPHEDLVRSCHDNVGRVLQLLTAAVETAVHDGPPVRDDPAHDPAYDAARTTGRRRAEQGLPLDDVLRSFRIGGRLIWDDLVTHGDPRLGARALREIGTCLWDVVDATSSQVAAAYHDQVRALVRADEQHRAELWEGVLGGRAREPGFAHEAAQRLDLPPEDDLVVVIAAPGFETRTAEARLAPHATAWVRRSESVVGLVALRESDPAEALRALAAVADEQALPVGASAVVAGLAAADEGYRQASLARRAQGATVGLVSFEDRLAEALLLVSPDVAAALRHRWIDPVLSLGAGESGVLLDTLEAWVVCAGSASKAAERAHCHRNTVLNRLHRVAAVTGRPLADDAPPVDLDLALRAWRMRA